MGSSRPRLFVLHAAGRADIGVPPRPEYTERAGEILTRLERAAPVERRRLLLLQDMQQDAGEVAPLASLIRQLDLTDNPELHLVVMSTVHREVTQIAQQVVRGVQDFPDLYGAAVTSAEVVVGDSLEERDVQPVVRRHLAKQVPTSYDRAVVTWGSGSTQLLFNGLDALVASGIPWSMVEVSPYREAKVRTYDPTGGLPVDPLVPLLRRWRCHDLLQELVQEGLVQVTPQQAGQLEQEATWWGQGYVEPTVERLLAVMAAALIRRDGSSGFAVRAYVERRYQQLLQVDQARLSESESLVDLLARFRYRPNGSPRTLGEQLGKIRDSRRHDVARSQQTESGRWLLSQRVELLNKFGAKSSHERQGPPTQYLDALREELAEVTAAMKTDFIGPFDQLPLVPADRVWYVSLLGEKPRLEVLEQVADAALDPGKYAQLDPLVRRYLGVGDNEPIPLGFLLLGTQSASVDRAVELRHRLAAQFTAAGTDRFTVAADVVVDRDAAGQPVDFSEQAAYDLLSRHLGEDTAAIVLVPTGWKPHVLSTMIAAQRIAAERGTPLYLRQLVNRRRDVVSASLHRLPMRFGTDVAIVTAALHALDVGELDTAARLLDTTSDGNRFDRGRSLADRVAALSHVLRCDLAQLSMWPQGMGGPETDRLALTLGLLPDRVAFWVTLSQHTNDVVTHSRSVIGACASIEQSVKKFVLKVLRNKGLEKTYRDQARREFTDLFDVRNQLPISHGTRLPGKGTVDDLVQRQTGRRFHTTVDLLLGMEEKAQEVVKRIQADAVHAGHLHIDAAILPHQRRPVAEVTLAVQYRQLRAEVQRMQEQVRQHYSQVRQQEPEHRPAVPVRVLPGQDQTE